jgi:hypothetical protein
MPSNWPIAGAVQVSRTAAKIAPMKAGIIAALIDRQGHIVKRYATVKKLLD